MSKNNLAEEFLSSLGLSEIQQPEKDPMTSLSGQESTLHGVDCDTDLDSAEIRKLFEMDNLRYSIPDDTKFHKKISKQALALAKSYEPQKVSESA